jgi:hypothetical protein
LKAVCIKIFIRTISQKETPAHGRGFRLLTKCALFMPDAA